MASIPSHGSVKDFDKALCEICNGVEDRKNEERPILEAFLRKQCCRMLDEQLAWTHRKASERLRSAAVKQERQLMSAQRAFDLKEQQCSARLEALRDRCQAQQLRAVQSWVASLDQAKLDHLIHAVFLHWAIAMQASRQKEASVEKPKAAREAACASPSKTINLQQVLQLPTPQRRKQNQRDAPRTQAESSAVPPAAKNSATTAVADDTRLEVSKPTLTCTSGGSTSWQPAVACKTSRTIWTGLTRSTSGSLCLAPGAPSLRAASVQPAFRVASPSPLRLARTKAPATSWASTGSVTPVAPTASSAGIVSATSRTIRSISTTVRRAPSATVSPLVVWAHPDVSSRPRVLRQVEIDLQGRQGKTKPYAFVQRLQGERPACTPCRVISYAQKFGK